MKTQTNTSKYELLAKWQPAIYVVAAVLHAATICSAQNLILNGDFSQGAADYSSDYTFVASGNSYQPGTYGLRASSINFNPSYATFISHAGDGGLMMLVDGYLPSYTVWSETVNVSTNETYLFSCWVTPSDSVNLPTLRFLVNSAQVGVDFPLPSTSIWTNFSATWNSSSSTTATISIVDLNNNPLAAGDDFALDDLSFVNISQPPVLGIVTVSNSTTVFWPSWATNYTLQNTTNLASPNWETVTNGIPLNIISNAVVYAGIIPTNSLPAAFFRLANP